MIVEGDGYKGEAGVPHPGVETIVAASKIDRIIRLKRFIIAISLQLYVSIITQ